MAPIKLFSFSILFLLFSCSTDNSEKKVTPQFKSFELSGTDTINAIDINGLRQGIWLMPISKDTMVYLNDTGFSAKTITTGEIIRQLKIDGSKGIMFFHDSLTVKSK